MHSDAIGTLIDTDAVANSTTSGIVALAGIADQGDFVEVNTEIGHSCLASYI